jgi:hypothetical protein
LQHLLLGSQLGSFLITGRLQAILVRLSGFQLTLRRRAIANQRSLPGVL